MESRGNMQMSYDNSKKKKMKDIRRKWMNCIVLCRRKRKQAVNSMLRGTKNS